jgi:hypothetical protein
MDRRKTVRSLPEAARRAPARDECAQRCLRSRALDRADPAVGEQGMEVAAVVRVPQLWERARRVVVQLFRPGPRHRVGRFDHQEGLRRPVREVQLVGVAGTQQERLLAALERRPPPTKTRNRASRPRSPRPPTLRRSGRVRVPRRSGRGCRAGHTGTAARRAGNTGRSDALLPECGSLPRPRSPDGAGRARQPVVGRGPSVLAERDQKPSIAGAAACGRRAAVSVDGRRGQ